MVLFGEKLLYSVYVVVFGQKLLYLGRSVCNRAKMVEFEQSGCILSKNWLNTGKVVCIRVKSGLYFLQGGCIRAKWLY